MHGETHNNRKLETDGRLDFSRFIVLVLILLAFSGCKPTAGESSGSAENASGSEGPVAIVESNVALKSSRPNGTTVADWKFHLRNNSERPEEGQVLLYYVDAEGNEFGQRLFQPITQLPANGEFEGNQEVLFKPGQFERAESFRTDWRPSDSQ